MLGWVLVLECSFSSRITLGVLIIQGGVCGKIPSCILFSGSFDSCRVDIIPRPKCLIEGAVISWVGWARFQFCKVLESQLRLSVRGGSSASVYRLSIGEVLYAPRASQSPWWCIVFSSFKYVFLAAPCIKQP